MLLDFWFQAAFNGIKSFLMKRFWKFIIGQVPSQPSAAIFLSPTASFSVTGSHPTASFSIYDSLGFAVWLGMKTIAEREQVLVKDNCRNGVSGVWYFGFAG